MLIKGRKQRIILFTTISSILASACITGGIIAIINENNTQYKNYVCKQEERIYLIGETHGKEDLYKKEFNKWNSFYINSNYRDLFVELPYYCAEILNVWMKEDNDARLDYFYDSLEGTQSHVHSYKVFLKDIKTSCPDTVFHGTDVGHLFNPLGNYYIDYLKSIGKENSEQYRLTMENFTQYQEYRQDDHSDGKSPVREKYMVENFKREYDALPQGTKIMGIYGSYHTNPREKDLMAGQLKSYYGDVITYHYASYVK